MSFRDHLRSNRERRAALAVSSFARSFVLRGDLPWRTSFPFSNTRSKNHVWSTFPRLISCGWFLMNSTTASSLRRPVAEAQISVVREEYAVSGDGMKMFGVLDLETTFDG